MNSPEGMGSYPQTAARGGEVAAFIRKELLLNQALLNLHENGNDLWSFCAFCLPLTTEQGGPERRWGALESLNANTGNFPCGLP